MFHGQTRCPTAFVARGLGFMCGLLLAAGNCPGQATRDSQSDWLAPESLAMPRERISASLSGPALRINSERGCTAIRDMTVTGIQRLSFPPLIDHKYRFNLAFREQATGTLIQDLQDEGGDPLYYNLNSNGSAKLGASRGGPDGWTWVLLSQDAVWQPNCYTRTGTFHRFIKGQMLSFGVTSRTSISSAADEIYEELEIENRMERSLTLTLIPDQHAAPRAPCFVFVSGNFQATAVSDLGPAEADGWRMEIPAKEKRVARIALLLEAKGKAAPQGYHAPDLAERIAKGQAATRLLLQWAARGLPKLDTNNRKLDEFYRRCILSALSCRWNRENFCARPFYDFGQLQGCSVTWDLSFASEMLAVLDPQGMKETLLAHFRGGIANCTWLKWNGKGFGNYVQHPLAVARILNDYMLITGDVAILDHVEREATLLEWMKRLAEETHKQYARPDGLLDYGGDTMKLLEIRTSGYEHVVAATNAMTADYFNQLAAWCRARNDPAAGQFQQWAEQLQSAVNNSLWNEREGWFENLYPDGSRHLVLSCHQFDVLGGRAVPLDRQRRMIARIKDGEFLGPYGMFSIARSDRAHWDREDCDFGGGGQYVGGPLRISESLYRLGESQTAWDVLSRCVRWVERFPYIPQTLYADNPILQPHQTDWPLEISSAAGAQAVIFGLFGLRPQPDGSLHVSPAYNDTLGNARLTGFKFRGHLYDVLMMPTRFQVYRDGKLVVEKAHGSNAIVAPSEVVSVAESVGWLEL